MREYHDVVVALSGEAALSIRLRLCKGEVRPSLSASVKGGLGTLVDTAFCETGSSFMHSALARRHNEQGR